MIHCAALGGAAENYATKVAESNEKTLLAISGVWRFIARSWARDNFFHDAGHRSFARILNISAKFKQKM